MILLNINNVEALIFKNKKAQDTLPELRHIFDQWLLGYRLPFMKNLRKQSFIDLLNSLDTKSMKKLSDFFGDTVMISKLDYHITKNFELDLDTNLNKLDLEGFNNFTLYRDSGKIFITFWR